MSDKHPEEHESVDTRAGLWIVGEVFKWPRWAQLVFVCVVCGSAGGALAALSLAVGHSPFP